LGDIILTIADLYEKAKERNVITGLLMYVVLTFIIYLIIPLIIVFPGDVALVLGGIFSLIFTLYNRKEHQSSFKLGIFIGLLGAILSTFPISFYQWIVLNIAYGFNLLNLWALLSFFWVVAAIIGLILGLIFGYAYSLIEVKPKKVKIDSKYSDESLEDLLKD